MMWSLFGYEGGIDYDSNSRAKSSESLYEIVCKTSTPGSTKTCIEILLIQPLLCSRSLRASRVLRSPLIHDQSVTVIQDLGSRLSLGSTNIIVSPSQVMDQRQDFGAIRQNKRQRDDDRELSQRVPTRELFASNLFFPIPAIDQLGGQKFPAEVPPVPRLTYDYSDSHDLSLAGTVNVPGFPVGDTGYPQFGTTNLGPPQQPAEITGHYQFGTTQFAATPQPTGNTGYPQFATTNFAPPPPPQQPASAQQLPVFNQTSLPLSLESRLTNQFALRSHYRGLNPHQQTPGLSRSEREQYARLGQDNGQWGGITKPATDGQKQPGEKCLTCVVNFRECDGDQLINDSCAECARRRCCCLWREPARGINSYRNAEAVARLERQVRVTRTNMATGYDPIVALTNLGSHRAEQILRAAAMELVSAAIIVDNPMQNTQTLYDHLRATSDREWMNGNDQDQWAYMMLTNILENAITLRLGLERAFILGWVNDYIRKYGRGTVPYGHPN